MAKLSQKYHTTQFWGVSSSSSYLFFNSFQHYFKDHYSSAKNVENALSASITKALSNAECYTLKK